MWKVWKMTGKDRDKLFKEKRAQRGPMLGGGERDTQPECAGQKKWTDADSFQSFFIKVNKEQKPKSNYDSIWVMYSNSVDRRVKPDFLVVNKHLEILCFRWRPRQNRVELWPWLPIWLLIWLPFYWKDDQSSSPEAWNSRDQFCSETSSTHQHPAFSKVSRVISASGRSSGESENVSRNMSHASATGSAGGCVNKMSRRLMKRARHLTYFDIT